MLNKGINIFCDGSTTNNGRPDSYGAYAYVVLLNDIMIEEKAEFHTGITNNQMELLGVIEALKYVLDNNLDSHTIYVHSDSQYVVNGITKWIKNWKNNNWLKGKTPPANLEYWKELDNLCQKFENIYFKWVKAHNNSVDIFSEYNEHCDQLCTDIIEQNGGISFESTKYAR